MPVLTGLHSRPARYDAVMKAVVVAVLLVACGNKTSSGTAGSGSGSGSGSAEEPWEREMHTLQAETVELLGKPETYGPGLAVAFKPLPEGATVAGPAYFWVQKVGLVAIDGGAVKVVVRDPDSHVYRMAITPDGVPVIANDHPRWLRDGKFVEIAKDGPLLVDTFDVAPDGVVWTEYNGELSHVENGAWVKSPVLEISESPMSLDFDAVGHVILTTFDTVSVLDGGQWKRILDGRKRRVKDKIGYPNWSQAVVAPNGELWLLGCSYLVRIANGKPIAMKVPDPGIQRGRFIAGVLVGIGCDDKSVVRMKPGAEIKIETAPMKTKVHTNVLRDAQEIDARGRIWTSSSLEGLAVVDADGAATTYAPGSIAEISGDVEAVGIAGGGPEKLPAGSGEAARGTISGTVLDHGKPVARDSVELCRFPEHRFTASPCELASDRVNGRTDEKGVFKIEAPLKTFRVVARVNGNWYTLFETECGGIAPGGDCPIGVMDTANVLKP
jgi:hypothetical protein